MECIFPPIYDLSFIKELFMCLHYSVFFLFLKSYPFIYLLLGLFGGLLRYRGCFFFAPIWLPFIILKWCKKRGDGWRSIFSYNDNQPICRNDLGTQIARHLPAQF